MIAGIPQADGCTIAPVFGDIQLDIGTQGVQFAPHTTADTNDGLLGLAAALAHEIKNPAAVALAHVASLRKRTSLHGIGDTCDHIADALEHIIHLVQEMLLVTYGTPPSYEFDLEDTLLDMLEIYQVTWPQIHFCLEADTAGMGLLYHGEEASVKMIFSNLLKNAVEAVGVAGVINVLLERDDKYVKVFIRDSGTDSAALKPHASGLGLQICKWLLGRAGGQMELAKIPTGGCEARVVLPA